jgi:hypothetical protein
VDRFSLWSDAWAPHLTPEQASDIVQRIFDGPPKMDADDDLGANLRLTYGDRQRLRIRTIGSHDVDRKSRKKLSHARRLERDRQRAAAKRRANGARLRKLYETHSLARTKPWEKLGISRRTFYRRRGLGTVGTSASPHPLILRDDGLVPRPPDAAREVSAVEPGSTASNPKKPSSFLASTSKVSPLVEVPTAPPLPAITRAASPTAEQIKRAIELADQFSQRRKFNISHQAVRRLFQRFWTQYVKDQIQAAQHYGRPFDPDRDLGTWHLYFPDVLSAEAKAIERYEERRGKWDIRRRQREDTRAARDWMNRLRNGRFASAEKLTGTLPPHLHTRTPA